MQQQDLPTVDGSVVVIFGAIGLAFAVLMFVSLWKVFTKADQPGPAIRRSSNRRVIRPSPGSTRPGDTRVGGVGTGPAHS